jgi:hypothetical protein
MKIKKLRLLLALTGLLVTEYSLGTRPKNAREIDPATYVYAPNSIALEQNARDEESFFDGKRDMAEEQEKAAAASYTKSLENKVSVEDKKIRALKKRLNATRLDVEQIKKEHAQLKKNNVEQSNK